MRSSLYASEDAADSIMAEALKELSPSDQMELKKTKTYRCPAFLLFSDLGLLKAASLMDKRVLESAKEDRSEVWASTTWPRTRTASNRARKAYSIQSHTQFVWVTPGMINSGSNLIESS